MTVPPEVSKPSEPSELERQIDSLHKDQFEYWLANEVTGWFPPGHAKTVDYRVRKGSTRKHSEKSMWYNPARDKLEYNQLSSACDIWPIVRRMFDGEDRQKAERLRAMMDRRRMSDIVDITDIGKFVSRCVLKAYLLTP